MSDIPTPKTDAAALELNTEHAVYMPCVTVPADFARGLERESATLRAQLEASERDAAKWRGVIGCARITAIGSAGLEKPNDNGYAHLTINLWTNGEREKYPYPREWLSKFADLAVKATTLAGAAEGDRLPTEGGSERPPVAKISAPQ